ncbi:GNAT acetyltransferase 2-domain-containing protein [Phlyctochytrium arcticum]|nr:GNAT acetyltransferase 2-domain-containing protein [Phlyctochytrium arcticum]
MVQLNHRKKLDSRIPTLIQNNVQTNKRSFFVIVGDRGKDQVVTLHFLLAKARVAARPNVLWCYKKDLGFTSHRKKRAAQIKRQIARGIKDPDEDDPFELFVSSTSIRYTYYKETDKILGNTYGMCVLQDFEALTPNLLARTVETVEGGGIVVILLKSMASLKQLYTMTMDVHARYRTESHQDTVARFNERFILSLGSCETCLLVDDELNVLPLSAAKSVKPLPRLDEEKLTPTQEELAELKTSLQDTQPVGSIIAAAKTIDQAKALLTFIDAIADKSLRSTVSLTAARGRGKSATLGLAISAAVSYGYSNIFITSPSPENLKTLFEFIFKGFDALGFEEHLDYDIVQSTNPAFQKAVVRVNIFREHRQTIQWIQPSDSHVLAQAELVVIDEAAAIPLPIVKKLLGPYLVFMASTINGYEGTGRSLSMKLLNQLREQSRGYKSQQAAAGVVVGRDGKERKSTDAGAAAESLSSSAGTRTLKELKLEEPIRYAAGDPVEAWLYRVLCLDCCEPSSSLTLNRMPAGCPHPSKCDLYYVNRDTLFSFHAVSEAFLQKMMALYVASHYKNTPNDLQLLSDAPAHHLFVLLPPIDAANANTLPEPLCVIQVCMEGQIARGSALSSLAKGVRSAGDLIPWVMTQQYQDDDFASLSGARVVRIATHPDYTGMGYGARALGQLEDYYNGKIASLSEDAQPMDITQSVSRVTDEDLENASLDKDDIRVRDASSMPPLLLKLSERPPQEHLHWLGVSFGITQPLHKFWKRAGYTPVYLRQTANELTGEHTCVMLKTLHRSQSDIQVAHSQWLDAFAYDFRRRYVELLGFNFKEFPAQMVLSIMEAAGALRQIDARSTSPASSSSPPALITAPEIYRYFSPWDIKRLDGYTNNLLDYHVIMDLIPTLARTYFLGQLVTAPSTSSTDSDPLPSQKLALSGVQATILAAMGLQRKTMADVEKELDIPTSQILAMFGKLIRKSYSLLKENLKHTAAQELAVPAPLALAKNEESRDVKNAADWDPTLVSLEDDLHAGENEVVKQLREEQRKVIDSLDIARYTIPEDVDLTLSSTSTATIVNVPSTKKRKTVTEDSPKSKSNKKDKEPTASTAAELAAQYRGDKGGIVDPKGLMKKAKARKSMKKASGKL